MPSSTTTDLDPASLQSIDQVAKHLQGCIRCPLGPQRHGLVVPGEGDARAPIMVVGEGPGEDEDRLGRPFVGRAGQLFDKILQSVGIRREEIFITNVVKCRPPQNRVPTDEEAATCGAFLLRQVELMQPRIIVCMGNTSRTFFLGKSDLGITRVRGTYFRWKDIHVVPVFHPSYLLRQPSREVGSPKWLMWQDFQEIKRRLDLIRAGQPLPGMDGSGTANQGAEQGPAGAGTQPGTVQGTAAGVSDPGHSGQARSTDPDGRKSGSGSDPDGPASEGRQQRLF